MDLGRSMWVKFGCHNLISVSSPRKSRRLDSEGVFSTKYTLGPNGPLAPHNLLSYFCRMVFDLPVTGEKVKPQQVTALHLFCGLAFVGTGAIICVYNYEIPEWGGAILGAGILLLATAIFRNKWLIGKQANRVVRVLELLISVAIALLSFKEQWKFPSGIFSVLSAAILFSLYWERDAGQALGVHVDEAGVHLPVTSRKRFVGWVEIEQVLLRYGVLSIDCVDNKLYQFDVSANTVDEEIFHAFCKAQVENHVGKRRKDEW